MYLSIHRVISITARQDKLTVGSGNHVLTLTITLKGGKQEQMTLFSRNKLTVLFTDAVSIAAPDPVGRPN